MTAAWTPVAANRPSPTGSPHGHLSVDPAISLDAATDALTRLERGSRELLEPALRRVRLRGADRLSPITAVAITLLQVTLDHLDGGVATASRSVARHERATSRTADDAAKQSPG